MTMQELAKDQLLGEHDETTRLHFEEGGSSEALSASSLLDIELGLLAVVFSACDAQSLLRVEIALGSCFGVPFRSSSGQLWNWVRVLREGGLSLDIGDSSGNVHRSSLLQLIPMKASLAAALRIASASMPLEGGWKGISLIHLSECAAALKQLHEGHPAGREIRNPDSGACWGRIERLGRLVHFDVHGCFQDESWMSIETSFCTNARLRNDRAWCARSSDVFPCVASRSLPSALTLRSFNSAGNTQGPEGGIFLGLDIRGIDGFFTRHIYDQLILSRRLDIEDLVHVAYIIRCGSVERKGGQLLKYSKDTGHMIEIGYKHAWHLAPLPNMGVALRIEGEHGSGVDLRRFVIDEDIVNAHWNNHRDGTDMAPLVCLEDNEFAAQELPAGSLDGCIALVRRGGGCGFAQKALAVQDAGAVACIIYEAVGDRQMFGEVLIMGAHYQGIDYPTPAIPTLLVSARDGATLLDIATAQGEARAQIHLGRSLADLRRTPQSFNQFKQLAASGEPVHVAVLLEAMKTSGSETGVWGPQVSWFQEPMLRRPDPNDANWVEVAEVTVLLG